MIEKSWYFMTNVATSFDLHIVCHKICSFSMIKLATLTLNWCANVCSQITAIVATVHLMAVGRPSTQKYHWTKFPSTCKMTTDWCRCRNKWFLVTSCDDVSPLIIHQKETQMIPLVFVWNLIKCEFFSHFYTPFHLNWKMFQFYAHIIIEQWCIGKLVEEER